MTCSITTDRYRSTATFAQIAAKIDVASRIAVFSHSKADGDSIGSMLALTRALTTRGVAIDMFLMGPTDENLLMIAGDTPYQHIEKLPGNQPPDAYDLVIVVDTGAWSQLEPVEQWLRARHDHVIGIDHHAHGDNVAALRVVDASKASTTQIIVELLDEMNCPLTGGVNGVAEALFVGLATDTGWFRHSNAGADVFSLAARLLACGVDKVRLHQIIEESHRPERLKLEARALSSLLFAQSGAVAIMSLGLDDFRETGGSVEDLTGMVNLPLSVRSVQVSILLAQSESNRTKASFRSKSSSNPVDPDELVDVNELAQQFGGGGHVHAAGAKFNTNLLDARETILRVFERDRA